MTTSLLPRHLPLVVRDRASDVTHDLVLGSSIVHEDRSWQSTAAANLLQSDEGRLRLECGFTGLPEPNEAKRSIDQ
jgi:hypothetical protein